MLSGRRRLPARAAVETDPITKRNYLAMEQRWLGLARSYDFAEQLSRFTEPFRETSTDDR
jgi:hypothetical protein